MTKLIRLLFIACLPVLLAGAGAHAGGVQAATEPTSGGGATTGAAGAPLDLQAAIDAAAPGDVLQVPPGHYTGPFILDKPLHLVGRAPLGREPSGEDTVLDGGGQDSVLVIRAAGATVENFVIRNSGNLIAQEDAGIVIQASDVTILNNRLEDVLYGIRAEEAHRLVVRGNHITGRDLDIARRGDGMRLWQSENGVVEDNIVEQTRDVIFWFSDGTVVRDNTFRFNRYGVHMMYTDGMQVLDNAMHHNSVGAYLMYSVDVLLQGNTLRNNRGPSGYGIGLKDMDAVTIRDNYFLDNRVGMFFDNTPARVDIEQSVERNVLAYNDIGVLMMPAVQRNILRHNTFLDNLEQVGVKGGGSQQGTQLSGNQWDGNYWSDYVGYDAGTNLATAAGINSGSEAGIPVEPDSEPDGIGDLPYEANSLFENLADRYPAFRLFHFSPIETAVDLAAQAFPIIQPKPKLTDAAPLMAPVLPAAAPQLPSAAQTYPLAVVAAGMLLAAAGILQFRLHAIRPTSAKPHRPNRPTPDPVLPAYPSAPAGAHHLRPAKEEQTMLTVTNLVKAYPQPGRPWWSDAIITAVDDLSFEVAPGQALALWGSNGAGKTTVLKCLLGLLSCSGDLRLQGLDLRKDGRRARSLLGYVPQELAFHADLSVHDSCRFYARLKNAPSDRIPSILAEVGLAQHADKRVGALSGGMKQRLALALALLADPPLLLLDEPTSNLDAETRGEFLAMLKRLRQGGKSMLFTSHHVEEVESLADQVLILRDGQRVAQGSSRELLGQLLPQRHASVHHLKVVVAPAQQITAQQILTAAGYAASPNGRGLWVTVTPEEKAAPLALLHRAEIEVLDFDV